MTRPVAERGGGRDWVERGSMTGRSCCRCTGDNASVEFDDSGDGASPFAMRRRVCATGRAGWSSATAPDVTDYPTAPLRRSGRRPRPNR